MSDYEPKEFDYDIVRRCVHKYLCRSEWARHLEDCIQDACMQWFEGRYNIEWNVIVYCRKNGIGPRGKQSAKTIEKCSIFVGLASDENEEAKEMGFLFDQKSIDIFEAEKEQDARQTFIGRLEEFLLPLNLKQETLEWALRMYKPSKAITRS